MLPSSFLSCLLTGLNGDENTSRDITGVYNQLKAEGLSITKRLVSANYLLQRHAAHVCFHISILVMMHHQTLTGWKFYEEQKYKSSEKLSECAKCGAPFLNIIQNSKY